MKLLKDKYIIITLGILFLFIAIPRLLYPDFDHGDEYSDASVLISGENFVKFGFIRSRFLPMHEVQLDKPDAFYTHFPPLHNIINGILRMLLKTESLRFFRGVALFFSFLNLVVWYLIVKRFTNSSIIGLLSAIFYFTNPIFIFCADSVHQFAYGDFLRSLIILVFLYIVVPPEKKRSHLVLLLTIWMFIIIETLVSFEYIVYLSLFFILYGYFVKISKGLLPISFILILLSAPVIGFLLHFLQNVWLFGSVTLAFQDLRNIAIERVAFSKDSSVNLTLLNWLRFVVLRNFSLVFLFKYYILLPFMFFAFFLYYNLLAESKAVIKRLCKFGILLAICGVSWYIAFPSHSLAHTFVTFPAHHLVPVASVAFAIFTYILYSFIKENNPGGFFAKIALLFIIFIIAVAGILNSELPVSGEKIREAEDFLVFKQCLLKLKEMSDNKDELGVNYYRCPFIRYYTNRRTSIIFEKPKLESLSKLPQYFIFFPYDNERSKELFQFLNQRYDSLFQCQSSRFPTIFFKLKN